MRAYLTLIITGLLLVFPFAPACGDAASGKIKAYTCTGCHGIPGYKNAYPAFRVPKIGGQNDAYVVAALEAYRSGGRAHPTMRLQAESLSDADIWDIAAWLSTRELSPPVARDDSGAPEKIQACRACHGVDGRSADPSFPVLAGQHPDYLAQALLDYRDGTRNNPIMGGLARDLSDEEIEELSQWYAGLGGLRDLFKD